MAAFSTLWPGLSSGPALVALGLTSVLGYLLEPVQWVIMQQDDLALRSSAESSAAVITHHASHHQLLLQRQQDSRGAKCLQRASAASVHPISIQPAKIGPHSLRAKAKIPTASRPPPSLQHLCSLHAPPAIRTPPCRPRAACQTSISTPSLRPGCSFKPLKGRERVITPASAYHASKSQRQGLKGLLNISFPPRKRLPAPVGPLRPRGKPHHS